MGMLPLAGRVWPLALAHARISALVGIFGHLLLGHFAVVEVHALAVHDAHVRLMAQAELQVHIERAAHETSCRVRGQLWMMPCATARSISLPASSTRVRSDWAAGDSHARGPATQWFVSSA